VVFRSTVSGDHRRAKPLGRYVADFYCASERLVIELDGDSHFTEKAARADAARTDSLAMLGLRVIRFTNAEVMECFEGVCERIKTSLQSTS